MHKRFVHLVLTTNTVQFASFAVVLLILDLGWLQIIGLAGGWEALFAYDSIIFSLIMYKTWKIRRDYAVTGIEIPLVSLILRDGEMQFDFPQFLSLFSWLYRRHLFLVRAVFSLLRIVADELWLISVMTICNFANILTLYVRLSFFFSSHTHTHIYILTVELFFLVRWRMYMNFPFPQSANFLIQSHSYDAVYQPSQIGNSSSCCIRVGVPLTCSYCSISVTLISRLMLNLHRTADAEPLVTRATSTNVDYNDSYYESSSILVIDSETRAWTYLGSSHLNYYLSY